MTCSRATCLPPHRPYDCAIELQLGATVLQRLLENRLFVKAEKCEFSCSSTTFLGYIITAGSIAMDLEKVRAVEQWPTPTDRKALHSPNSHKRETPGLIFTSTN